MAWKDTVRCGLVCGLMVVTAMTVGGMQPSDKAMTAVDVNRATVTELMTVPGMTEVWARRIVRFRPYRRKTDLVDHGVISAEEYGKIRNYVVAHRVAEERGKQANTQ